MIDLKKEERKQRLRVLCILLCIIALLIFLVGIFKSSKSDNNETLDTSTVETTQEVTIESPTEETPYEIVKEATPSEITETQGTNTGLSDDVIKELKEKQVQEGLTPEQNAEAWENALKGQISQTADPTTTAEQPTAQPTEGNTGPTAESTEPAETKSEGRDFNIVDPKKPTMNADGELEKDITEKVREAMLPGSGPTITENNSETMKVGRVIKNYINSDIGRNRVGDTIMLNEIGLKVSPILSEPGYTVKSYNDTVELTFPKRGMVYITKVPDLDVTKLTLEQVQDLGNIQDLANDGVMNPYAGSFTQYSYLVTSRVYTRAIQYYRCPYGTFQLLYTSAGGPQMVTILTVNISMDESINAIPPTVEK